MPPSTPKPTPKRYAALVLLATEAVPYRIKINDFDTGPLLSVKAHEGHVVGFTEPMERYHLIHPYFLKRGPNRLSADYHLDLSYMVPTDMGPWQLKLQVAAVRPELGAEGTYPFARLAELASPPLPKTKESAQPKTASVPFEWADALPEWRWSHGVVIRESEEVKKSLGAEYQKLWSALDHGYQPKGAKADPGFAALKEQARASTAEFIQASEWYGKKYTFLDVLFETARRRALPDQPQEPQELPKKSPQDLKRELERAISPVHDGNPHSENDPVALNPDGSRPPRLGLVKLPELKDLKLVVFASGTLAMLTTADGNAPFGFYSNYHDGAWGAGGDVKLEFNAWFRKNDKNEWELDALYPMTNASLELWNDPMKDLLEQQPY